MSSDGVRMLRPYVPDMAAVLVLVVASAVGEALGLLFLAALLSAIAPAAGPASGPLSSIFAIAEASPERFLVLIGIVYVAKSLIALWTNYASFSLGLRMADDWRLRLLRGYLTTPLPRLTRPQGSMLQMIADEPSTVGAGIAAGGLLMQNLLSAASVYAALLVLSPLLTIGLTTTAAVATVAVLFLSRIAQRTALRRSLAINETYAYVTEMLGALKQLRLFDLERSTEARTQELLLTTRRLTRSANVLVSSPRLLIEVVFLVGLGVMLGILIQLKDGSLPIAEIGLVVAATFRLLPSLSATAGTWVQFQQARPGLERISSELAHLEETAGVAAASAGRSAIFRDRIGVEDVQFAYPGRGDALRGISLEIGRGEVVGIVGPSGSGKSTLVDLLCGLYPPKRGRILVDGVDLQTINDASWRRRLGVVAQDSFLFGGTLRDNVLLLNPAASVSRVDDVIELVGATEFIRSLPDRLDTRLGERGVLLSGGQRQRLALARVLLRDPEILILDEALSALDNTSDEMLWDRLERSRGAMTMIVIAHRLASVRRAHRIYVMSEGRVVEQGAHEDLLRLGAVYASLWRASTGTVRQQTETIP